MDWDDAYANGAHIEGAMDYPPRWAAEARAFRDGLGALARCDISYGASPRETLDLFLPGAPTRGLAVFVHGGYWMKFDPSVWSHLAAGALGHGFAVAMPGYTLCPDIRIAGITRQIAAAIDHAAGLVGGPIHLAGHSAGGHLVSRMVCADSPLSPATRTRIVHVLSISGVHDLRPLLATSMNETLGLDPAEAEAESPALLTPVGGTCLTCWVGADERPEFVRQNALLANVWTGLGAKTRAVEVPGQHHFNVIEALADPGSDLVGTWLLQE